MGNKYSDTDFLNVTEIPPFRAQPKISPQGWFSTCNSNAVSAVYLASHSTMKHF